MDPRGSTRRWTQQLGAAGGRPRRTRRIASFATARPAAPRRGPGRAPSQTCRARRLHGRYGGTPAEVLGNTVSVTSAINSWGCVPRPSAPLSGANNRGRCADCSHFPQQLGRLTWPGGCVAIGFGHARGPPRRAQQIPTGHFRGGPSGGVVSPSDSGSLSSALITTVLPSSSAIRTATRSWLGRTRVGAVGSGIWRREKPGPAAATLDRPAVTWGPHSAR